MRNKVENHFGTTLVLLIAYIFVYNLFAFEMVIGSDGFNDAIRSLSSVSGIIVKNIPMLIIILTTFTCLIICVMEFVIFKIFLYICKVSNISSNKLLVTILLSLIMGLVLSYVLFTFTALPVESNVVKIINNVGRAAIMCFLLSDDLERKQMVRFAGLIAAYTLVSLGISVLGVW